MTGTQPRAGPGSAAEGYWRATCLLSFSHAVGLSWPPPGTPQRRAAAGHWGCNPGIAWIAGHLAEAAPGEFLLVLGTGHASGYVFAHQALRSEASAAQVSAAIRCYGQPHGEPTELLGIRDMPYLGGELGPALGVSQGIAASLPGKRVVVVVGDGECETPAALAALAHHDVLGPAPGAAWLPVVNVNGARMGSAARFSPERLCRLLGGLGFTVLRSGPDAAGAARAARQAWLLAGRATPVAWLSVTDKGWPAPEQLGGQPFRGHHAHKPRGLNLADPGLLEDVTKWLNALNDPPVVSSTGEVRQDVRLLAGRIRLDLPAASVGPSPCRRESRTGPAVTGPVFARSPMAAADRLLAGRRVRVLSPDEASSNRLTECLAAGLVTEVLAEELCSAWAWGCTEGGTQAVVVSYEAFAPLIATQLAQYFKLLRARRPAGRPALPVVLTSLGWGNSPTHQNTDLVAGLLARAADGPARVVFPVGASSVARRLRAVLDAGRDEVAVFSCSKQLLADLPDPGGTAIGIRMSGVVSDDAVIIAAGDVVVTEAVAAMVLAAAHRVRIGVVALVEPGRLDLRPEGALRQACHPRLPAVCASWVAAHHLAAAYWAVRPAATAHLGYRERWGATAWETLAANGLTRWSLLCRLRDAGCALPPGLELPPGAETAPPVPEGLSCEVRPL